MWTSEGLRSSREFQEVFQVILGRSREFKGFRRFRELLGISMGLKGPLKAFQWVFWGVSGAFGAYEGYLNGFKWVSRRFVGFRRNSEKLP